MYPIYTAVAHVYSVRPEDSHRPSIAVFVLSFFFSKNGPLWLCAFIMRAGGCAYYERRRMRGGRGGDEQPSSPSGAFVVQYYSTLLYNSKGLSIVPVCTSE